ncbi:MAG: molybdopterin-binding protein [Candidatus Methanomethylicia archaeon]
MNELNLLGKTELWITNIKLNHVNLNSISETVARVLKLSRNEVFVTDVREDYIVLDILRETIDPKQIFGKKDELLMELAKIPGFIITPETDIHSEGVLSFISLNKEMVETIVEESQRIIDEVKKKMKMRAIVFPTGFEVKRGIIKDTNTPLIIDKLEKEGFKAVHGPVLDDDEYMIAAKIREAVDSGFGLIILTGGVGAEDKDKTIEGIEKATKNIRTEYVVKYHQGKGRHAKSGVRIAVGRYGESIIIALPGPTDEVKECIDIVIEGVKNNLKEEELAEKIANKLKLLYLSRYNKYLHTHH